MVIKLTDKVKKDLEEMVEGFVVASQEIADLSDPAKIEKYMRETAPRKGFKPEWVDYAVDYMHQIMK